MGQSSGNETLLAVIGLGQMGVPVAERLLQAGHRVMGVTHGTPPARFLEQGGQSAAAVSSLAGASVIFSLVTDDASTREIALGAGSISGALGPGVIHVAMGSLSLDLCRELTEGHAAAGQGFVAAPVFGRPDAAAAGRLSIVCSGERASFDQTESLLHNLGQPRWIGAEVHLSNLVKLAGNQMIFTTVALLGEVFAIFRKAGIAETEVKALLVDTLFPGPIFAGYTQRIADRDWEGLPRGLQIARKDNAHCLAAAEAMGAELPLFQFLRDRIARVSDSASGPVDITALARQVAIESGLSV